MEAGYDMDFPDAFLGSAGFAYDVVDRHLIRAGLSLAPAERAELAPVHAKIRGIDVHVLHKIDAVAVLPLRNERRHAAEGQKVEGTEQRDAVLAIQAFSRENLLSD